MASRTASHARVARALSSCVHGCGTDYAFVYACMYSSVYMAMPTICACWACTWARIVRACERACLIRACMHVRYIGLCERASSSSQGLFYATFACPCPYGDKRVPTQAGVPLTPPPPESGLEGTYIILWPGILPSGRRVKGLQRVGCTMRESRPGAFVPFSSIVSLPPPGRRQGVL